jgi:hypothetical protein
MLRCAQLPSYAPACSLCETAAQDLVVVCVKHSDPMCDDEQMLCARKGKSPNRHTRAGSNLISLGSSSSQVPHMTHTYSCLNTRARVVPHVHIRQALLLQHICPNRTLCADVYMHIFTSLLRLYVSVSCLKSTHPIS